MFKKEKPLVPFTIEKTHTQKHTLQPPITRPLLENVYIARMAPLGKTKKLFIHFKEKKTKRNKAT